MAEGNRHSWRARNNAHGRLAPARSRDRGEADRARAVLLTLSGWTSPRIAEAFGVREDTVRLWRSDFMRDGVAALKATVALDSACEKRGGVARGHAVAGGAGRRSAQLDHSAPARRDRGAGGRAHQPLATVETAAQKKFRWRRPRHTLKRVARTPPRSNESACACNCASSRPKPTTSFCFMATRARR